MAQGPMMGGPEWEAQMKGIWDRTRGQQMAPSGAPQPDPMQVAAGPQQFMAGDTVRVMTMNGPYNATVVGHNGRGQALISTTGQAFDAQAVDEGMLKRLDGPLTPDWRDLR
jgi:hypothetical protein